MLRLAGHTCAHDHNGNSAVREHKPVQNGSGQDIAVNHRFPSVFDCPCKTGPGFGRGPFASSFRSGRVPPSLAIRMARGAASNLPASLASLFNHIADRCGQTVAHLSRLPVWRASRCLTGKEFLQGQKHLIGVGRSALGHLSTLFSFVVADGLQRRAKGLGRVLKVSGEFPNVSGS